MLYEKPVQRTKKCWKTGCIRKGDVAVKTSFTLDTISQHLPLKWPGSFFLRLFYIPGIKDGINWFNQRCTFITRAGS